MNWQDYLALTLCAAAAAVIAWRAYRALRGEASPGCGSGCGTCSSNKIPAQQGNLLSIGPPPK
jgi:hypothetical protein